MAYRRLSLRAPVLAFSIAGLGMAAALPMSAAAQQATLPSNPPPDNDTSRPAGLAEVTVTARKVEERLQNVPVSVTAFTGAELAQQSAHDFSDLQALTPNLRIRPNNANPSSAVVTIRGQSQNDTLATLDAAVGTYVDGVYYARSVGLNVGLVDLDSAQVLRGPQGTLFGRNTSGGAIVLATGSPSFDGVSGFAKAGGGSHGNAQLQGVLNVPLVADHVALRVAAQGQRDDGYGTNLFDGRATDKIQDTNVRAKLAVRFDDDLDALFGYESFNLNGLGPGPKLRLLLPTSPGNVVVARESQGQDAYSNYVGGSLYQSDFNSDMPAHAHTDTGFATLNWKLPFAQLKATGAYRSVYNNYSLDLDSSPYVIADVDSSTSGTHQWTGELQLTGDALQKQLHWIAGYFYFDETGYDESVAYTLPTLNPANPNIPKGFIGSKSQAVYSQVTYNITEPFAVTGGLRYTSDDKSFAAASRNAFPPGMGGCLVPPAVLSSPDVCYGRFPDLKHDNVSYLASASYQLQEDLLLYISTSSGYRAGGYNLRGSVSPIGPLGTYAPFGPEHVVSYETGVKSEFLDRRLRINADIYYTPFRDIQRSDLVTTPTGGFATVVSNAARATVKGAEVEATALLPLGFQLQANGGYTNARYTKFADASGDHSDEAFPNTPRFTSGTSVQYEHDVGIGNLMMRADYMWTSTVNFTGSEPTYTVAATGQVYPLALYTSQHSYGLMDLRASVTTFNHPQIEFAVYGKNVLNKHYFVSDQDLVSGGLGFVNGTPGRPAVIGAEVSAKF